MAKKIRREVEVERATRKFTDREEPRKVFWNKYNMMKENISNLEDAFVITYYGIGGIGKSSLLRKIAEEIEEEAKVNNEKPYYLLYDFEDGQEPNVVLTMMKNKLQSEYGFSFFRYDLATYKHAIKIGKDANKPEVKSIIENSKILSTIFDIAGEIPGIENVSKIAKYADRIFAKLRTKFDNRHKTFVENLEKESPERIYKNLAKYFAQDLRENIEKLNKPFVILLDTYEKMVNEINNVGYVLTKDLWLRGDDGLIVNVPRVLWVIAGREMIKWGKHDKDWEGTLDQHRLGDLDYNDAADFLREAGVIEENIIKQIYDVTNGTPLYLDLCLSTYEDMKNAGEEITTDKFGDTKEELIERYIRYMDIQTREIVYMLSQIGNWDDVLINDVACKIINNFSIEQYETIKELSFVYQNDDNEYYIHKTVREVLNKICPKMICEKYQEAMNEYIIPKLQMTGYFGYYKTYYRYLNKLYEIKSEIANKNNVEQIIEELYTIEKNTNYDWNFSKEKTTYLFYEVVYGKNDDKTIKAMIELSYYYKSIEEERQALEYAEMACERSSERNKNDNELLIEAKLCYLMAYFDRYGKIYDNRCFEISQEVYKTCLNKYGEKNKFTIKALFLCYLFIPVNFNTDADKWIETLKKLYRNCKEVLGTNDISKIETMLNMQEVIELPFDEVNEIERNEILYEKYLNAKETDKTVEILYYIGETYNAIAREYYINVGKKVLEVFSKIYKIYLEKYGKESYMLLEILYYFANIYYQNKDYQKVLETNTEIYNILLKSYEEDTEKSLEVLVKIVRDYYNVGNYEKAIKVGLEACEKFSKKYGEESEEILSVYEILSMTYSKLNMNSEKQEIENKACQICLQKFGRMYFFRLYDIFKFDFLKEAYEKDELFVADDFLYPAIDFAIQEGKVTTSLLQRKFRVGYARATRILEQMAQKGIIDKKDKKPVKKIIITKEEYEKLKNNNQRIELKNNEQVIELEKKFDESYFNSLKNSIFNTTNYHIIEKSVQKKEEDSFRQAVDFILEAGKVTTSMLQRRLKITYVNAARIIDKMEEMGIISEYKGAAPRDILITKEKWEAMQKQNNS